MHGRIMASLYGVYTISCGDQQFSCKPRGTFRHKDLTPLVGDFVDFDENTGVIFSIDSRKSELKRPHIANVDQVAIVMSAVEPTFSSLLVDKFLTYVNASQLRPLVIISKSDKQKDIANILKKKSDLEMLDVPVIIYSQKTKIGVIEIISTLKGKTTVLMGQTGVGKSSLLNVLSKDFTRKVGEYSTSLGRGKHQTKEVVLLPFDSETLIADTPGFSSLDLELFKSDIAQFFPGFSRLATECYFANCLHVKEKKCKILEKVALGEISQESYQNYLVLLEEAKMRKEWN